MNKKEFDKTPRDPVKKKDLDEALTQALTAPLSKAKSENREPARVELNQRWKLVRK